VKIIVDADGCPKGVLQSCLQQGKRRQIQVWTVANYHHQIESDNHITVDGASQEADMKVVNMTDKGDLVVTQDWGLAALILGKGARCLHPSGREYQNETIDFMLEERDMKARLRRSGGRTKGPSKRTAEEDQLFQDALIRVLEASPGI
jgi:uncharacterized protein YaiI (UPF0178 family)